MVESTPEAKAFREAGGDLVEYLQNPGILGWKLYSKRLIGKEVRDKTTMIGRSREEKCMTIVDSLEKLISLDPKKFHEFLDVLENGDDNVDLWKQMKMSYNDIKKKTEKGQRSNAPGLGVMESHMPGLRTTLQYMKSLKPNTESDKRIEVIEILKSFIEKSLQGGAKLEEVKANLVELYRQDLLLNEPEYGWALSNVDELDQARTIIEKGTQNSISAIPKKKQTRESMFSKETIYYASLCCLTVNNCDSSNYIDFLRTKHPHHEFSEASISRTREGEVDRYLVVKEGKTYYIAFKGEQSLMEWKKNYGSFDEGIKAQCSRIPLRFFVQQINDGYSIVLTGFSFGGLLACSVVANLCRESYLTSDQITSNVVCITFGLPLVNIASVMETAQQIPVLNTILHNVLMENDILPKILTFLQNGFGAKMTITTDDQMVSNPFSPLILQYLSEIQNAYRQSAHGVSSTCSKVLDDVKELLIETLSQRTVLDLTNGAAAAMEILPTGNFYMISTLKFHWSEVSEKQSSTLYHLSSEQISSIKIDDICKPSINDYFNAITRGYLEETPVYSLPPRSAAVTEMPLLKPSITSIAFHHHGKELAVVIEGNNFWFCTKAHVSSIPHIKIEPDNISRKTIQFNYTPKDESDIPEGDTIGVQLFSHFTNPIRKHNIPVKRKVYRFTYRQEQLAKHTPSELIELAYMSALLERHPSSLSEPLSNRFRVLRSFLQDVVGVVPIESVPYTIASADDNLVGPCCKALIDSNIILLPPSTCMKAGMMRALHRLNDDRKYRIDEEGLYNSEYSYITNCARKDRYSGVESEFTNIVDDIILSHHSNEPVKMKNHVDRVLNKNHIRILKNEKRQEQSKPPGKLSIPMSYRLTSFLPDHQNYSINVVESAYARVFISVSPDHLNHQLIKQLLKIAPPTDVNLGTAICGLNIDLLYPPTGSRIIHCPLDILVVGRKLLSDLIDKMSDQKLPAMLEVNSISQLCNTQMLQIINGIRQNHVRLCTSLLGSFMEEQMQVPLKRTPFDTAQAIFTAVSVAAMGVWALFNLTYQDVNSLLSKIPNNQLFVQVKDYIRGMFSENTINLDRKYAGKLQFMVQGLEKTVSCNSHYISYSLERQLVLLCDKLNISANTSTERIVEGWDALFKDNVLALIAVSHRSLIARWMRWALMVHNLREELAKYTAVGVVGLVNSGKSKLVNSLFGIQVAVGTTECKRTTVPFLYNLDQMVEGLDVIDFPGVDDRDETIPDLAELLLSLAQVVIFVVDYRRVHTESVKHWLEHLEKDPVHVLVCLTHADQLYVEYMNEDGTHRPSDIVRREIKIQLDMIKEKLGSCPRHTIQLFSICQGKDSVLNTPEGRKVLKDVGIGMPQDIGDWLVKVLEKHLDQHELSERLKQYIYKDDQQTDAAPS